MDSYSLRILAEYVKHKSLTLVQLGAILDQSSVDLAQYVLRLMEKSLLEIERNYALMNKPSPEGVIGVDVPLVLTIDGRELLEAEARKEKERRKARRHRIINTVIAVLSLIVSIVSAVIQYLWRL